MITSGSVAVGTVSATLIYSTPDGVKTNLFLLSTGTTITGGATTAVIGDADISVNSGGTLVAGFPMPSNGAITEITGFTGSLYGMAWPYEGDAFAQVNYLATDDR